MFLLTDGTNRKEVTKASGTAPKAPLWTLCRLNPRFAHSMVMHASVVSTIASSGVSALIISQDLKLEPAEAKGVHSDGSTRVDTHSSGLAQPKATSTQSVKDGGSLASYTVSREVATP